jgi:hypothetical protein
VRCPRICRGLPELQIELGAVSPELPGTAGIIQLSSATATLFAPSRVNAR